MRILLLSGHFITVYAMRMELVEVLLALNHEVTICCMEDEKIKSIIDIGCSYEPIRMSRRGMNPIDDINLLEQYKKIISKVKPDIVLGYTVKPNIYGAMAAKKHNIPFIANITGMGTAIENGGIVQKIILTLYKYSFREVKTIFFQNKSNMDFFEKNKINTKVHKLLNGSGVNLEKHQFSKYPNVEKPITFLFVGRIMKNKGIDEYLYCAEYIKKKYGDVNFNVLGMYDDERYKNTIITLENNGVINYFGAQDDVIPYINDCHAIVLPSYHEGMSNALLEASAHGRPVLATNVPGCKETFNEGETGFGCEPKNSNGLIDIVQKFIELPHSEKEKMGLAARRKMELEFDRKIIVQTYIKEINEILGDQ